MKTLLILAVLAVAASSGEVPLPQGARTRFGGVDAAGGLGRLAFSPDGRTLAAAADDGSVRLFSSESGREILRLAGHKEPVRALAFSPDGRTLASGGEGGLLLLHDVASGRLVRSIRSGRVAVNLTAFLPGGKQLISSGERRTLEVWELSTGHNVRSPAEHGAAIEDLAVSPDGRVLATSGGDKALRVWDAASGGLLFIYQAPGRYGTDARDLSFSADGRTLFAREARLKSLLRFAVPSGRQSPRIELGERVAALRPRPGTDRLGLLSCDEAGKKWSLELLNPVDGGRVTVFRAQSEASGWMAFSPDGRTVAVAGPKGTGLLWSAEAVAPPAPAPAAGPSSAAVAALMASWEDPKRAESYFDALRRRYPEAEGYDPYGESTRKRLEALRQAIEDEDFKGALAAANELLTDHPVHAEAHGHAATACVHLGDLERSKYHQRVARGLVDSVRRSGDGKSPKTAFQVVSLDEELATVASLAGGRERLARSNVEAEGRQYDVWQLAPAPGQADGPEEVYFDITTIWHWSLRRFGAEE